MGRIRLTKVNIVNPTHPLPPHKTHTHNNNKKCNIKIPPQGISIPTTPQAEAPTATVKE